MVSQKEELQPYWTIPEVAALLNVSPATIWRMLQKGEISAIRLSKGITRITSEELERFIDKAQGNRPDNISTEHQPKREAR